MYHYNFTNDLRISALDTKLQDTAYRVLTGTLKDDKSANNNASTLAFYFNLHKDSNLTQIAANGNVRKVVLNFIKKFQFPNIRTFEDYNNSNIDNIKLAPMRLILKLLYLMTMIEGESAYLTKNEIIDFIFYNSQSTQTFSPNILEIYESIRAYRETTIMPSCVETNESNRYWKDGKRQIGEMLAILKWSGCVAEYERGKIQIRHQNLTLENKSDVFDIVNYNGFWEGKFPCEKGSYKKVESDVEKSYESYMDISLEETEILDVNITALPLPNAVNVLIYGVPGCGKSHYIKSNYPITDENSERVVFHPDYTYSDFVGQILPQVRSAKFNNNCSTEIADTDEYPHLVAEDIVDYHVTGTTIEYDFIEGPFTRLLKRCQTYKDKMHYLVIEEINRGNAPAIFGEIFQLLDRNSSGVSEYGISNTDIAKKVYDDENQKVKIPNNLTILATMNTADQNVFTLDTAFKRRWEMLSIRNNFKTKDEPSEENIEFNAQLNYKLCDSSIDWKTFAVAINKVIIEESESNLGNEDKRLGHFFIKQAEMSDVSKFSEKVIMYLWNDVFKFEKNKVFNDKYKTLEDLLDAFTDSKVRFDVFNENLGFKNITKDEPQEDSSDGDADGE